MALHCGVCNKDFSRPQSLSNHMRSRAHAEMEGRSNQTVLKKSKNKKPEGTHFEPQPSSTSRPSATPSLRVVFDNLIDHEPPVRETVSLPDSPSIRCPENIVIEEIHETEVSDIPVFHQVETQHDIADSNPSPQPVNLAQSPPSAKSPKKFINRQSLRVIPDDAFLGAMSVSEVIFATDASQIPSLTDSTRRPQVCETTALVIGELTKYNDPNWADSAREIRMSLGPILSANILTTARNIRSIHKRAAVLHKRADDAERWSKESSHINANFTKLHKFIAKTCAAESNRLSYMTTALQAEVQEAAKQQRIKEFNEYDEFQKIRETVALLINDDQTKEETLKTIALLDVYLLMPFWKVHSELPEVTKPATGTTLDSQMSSIMHVLQKLLETTNLLVERTSKNDMAQDTRLKPKTNKQVKRKGGQPSTNHQRRSSVGSNVSKTSRKGKRSEYTERESIRQPLQRKEGRDRPRQSSTTSQKKSYQKARRNSSPSEANSSLPPRGRRPYTSKKQSRKPYD